MTTPTPRTDAAHAPDLYSLLKEALTHIAGVAGERAEAVAHDLDFHGAKHPNWYKRVKAARKFVINAEATAARASLPMTGADDLLVDWPLETKDPLAEIDSIYEDYAKTFGRVPDEFMANQVRRVKERLFWWWGWHRDRIRAALLAASGQGEQPVAWMRPDSYAEDDDGCCLPDSIRPSEKAEWEAHGGRQAEHAALYTIPLYTRPAPSVVRDGAKFHNNREE